MFRQAQRQGHRIYRLIFHPDAPPKAVSFVEAIFDDGRLNFAVIGGPIRVPSRAMPERRDGLWRTTCFELFVKPIAGEGYFEFNFSPSTEWAAYRFDDYRAGIADLPIADPVIEPVERGILVTFDLSPLPLPPWRIGLSAIVEEADGTKSYWALAHPPGKPDFHDDTCFALELPAAG